MRQGKNDKAGDNSYDESPKGVSENSEASSTTKQDKRRRSRKRKRYSPLSSPEIVKCSNKRRRKKTRSRRGKRKRSPSSSFISSPSFGLSIESENEMVEKRFKIVPKGEEFKWGLPSNMADYANLHFKNCIPDKKRHQRKDIDGKSSSIKSTNFVKTLLVSQTTISTNHQMKKFQEDILQV